MYDTSSVNIYIFMYMYMYIYIYTVSLVKLQLPELLGHLEEDSAQYRMSLSPRNIRPISVNEDPFVG